MTDPNVTFVAIWHTIYGALRATFAPLASAQDGTDRADRGAVSIEHVLWYAAAAISVAVVATIIWTQVRNTANTTVRAPSAP